MALPIEKIEQIKALWDAGKSKAEISRVVGVSPVTVASYVGTGYQGEYQQGKVEREQKKADDVPFATQAELDAGIAQISERKSVDAASNVLKDSVELAAKVWHDALAGTAEINATRFNTAKAILKKHGLLAEDEQVVTKSVYDTMTNYMLTRKMVEAARAIGVELQETQE